MKINIEDIIKLNNEIKQFNELDLSKVKFYFFGKRIKFSKKLIDDFKFTGLDNNFFIKSGFFEQGLDNDN
jgi:hypothetical protein